MGRKLGDVVDDVLLFIARKQRFRCRGGVAFLRRNGRSEVIGVSIFRLGLFCLFQQFPRFRRLYVSRFRHSSKRLADGRVDVLLVEGGVHPEHLRASSGPKVASNGQENKCDQG